MVKRSLSTVSCKGVSQIPKTIKGGKAKCMN